MSAFGWIATGRRAPFAAFFRRPAARKPARRSTAPGVESLETIDLMSRAGLPLPAVSAQAVPFTASTTGAARTPAAAPAQVRATQVQTQTQTQTATVPTTLTNFDLPFAPPVNLFNPTLGQLMSVQVTVTAALNSQIRAENTSANSGASITGATNGTFQVSGFPASIAGNLSGQTQTVTVPPFAGGPIDFTGPSSVTFPPLSVTNTVTTTFNQPADLAFFTAGNGRAAVSPQLNVTALSGATAPNGNLQTDFTTSGAGVLSVVYTYLPVTPTVTNLTRFGIHHQPTRLQLTFSGPLNPADASNPAFYTVIAPNRQGSFTGPGTTTIPVTSAVYNPAANTVTLTTARLLNFHNLYQLRIALPSANGGVQVIEFGGRNSVGGFNNHHGQFVQVNGGRVLR